MTFVVGVGACLTVGLFLCLRSLILAEERASKEKHRHLVQSIQRAQAHG